MNRVTIVDTFGFFFRSYYALPPLKSPDGFPTGLLTGFINFINNIAVSHSDDYIIFALDSKGDCFRHKLYKEYKANRDEAPEDLKKQLPVAIKWIEKMGFCHLLSDDFEADDIIATLALKAKNDGLKVRIVSHDKDLYQLIDDDICLYDPIKKIDIDRQRCIDKFGIEPKYILDYLSIVGDSSDNIPGVKGIGAKGAISLINSFGSLHNIYSNIPNIDKERTKKLLLDSQDNAFLSHQLVTLEANVPLPKDFTFYRFPQENPIEKIRDDLLSYGIKNILSKSSKKSSNELTYEPILLDNYEKLIDVIETIDEEAIVAFDTETDDVDVKKANIVGFSFAYNENFGYYVPIAHNYLGVGNQISHENAIEAIKMIFTKRVVGQNLKFDLAILKKNFGIEFNFYADTMILAWLLDPSSSVGLDNLASRFFTHNMIKFKDTVKKGENFSNVPIEDACKYASEDAWMTLLVYRKLISLLDTELLEVAQDIEFSFIKTLMHIESNGIKADINHLENLLSNSNKTIINLTKSIYQLCDMEFNINSPSQLGKVLFEQLGLKSKKKTKSGYSTDEKVLKSLADQHEVIAKILEYREIHKLKSTYIEPLLKLSKQDHNNKIYTSFLQTGTSTGRLSSKNPNLQNIPVKTEAGNDVRNAFISQDGYSLVSIDYSQIELRFLAHFSKDSALIEAFNLGEDIHLMTSNKIFGSDRAIEKRSVAKSINFGLLYGMGSKKLSETVGVSTKEAKEMIEGYFNSFPTVKSYLENVKEQAKNDGYVKTLLGRKRYFDFANATGFMVASYEREAPNTIFQGSTADIIKMSMNKIDQLITNSNFDAKMVLQIHDELIFEIKDDLIDQMSEQFLDIMENIYKLEIPLVCSCNIAKRWGELK
jgi:DNA polymerase-1